MLEHHVGGGAQRLHRDALGAVGIAVVRTDDPRTAVAPAGKELLFCPTDSKPSLWLRTVFRTFLRRVNVLADDAPLAPVWWRGTNVRCRRDDEPTTPSQLRASISSAAVGILQPAEPAKAQVEVRAHLWKDRALLDRFVRENPFSLDDADMEQAQRFKNGHGHGLGHEK